jgi:alpha-ketoglutarate-dependent taurine dioxygenase
VTPIDRSQLGWEATPIADCLGAELTGPDLTSLSDQELNAIRAALLKYEVIFFRGQADMKPADHLHLASAFGDVQLHEAYPHVAGFPAITVREGPSFCSRNFFSIWIEFLEPLTPQVLENDRENPSLIEEWVREGHLSLSLSLSLSLVRSGQLSPVQFSSVQFSSFQLS